MTIQKIEIDGSASYYIETVWLKLDVLIEKDLSNVPNDNSVK